MLSISLSAGAKREGEDKALNNNLVGGVEKVNFFCDTPKSPRGNLLNTCDLESPPWGVWGCKPTFSTAPMKGGEYV